MKKIVFFILFIFILVFGLWVFNKKPVPVETFSANAFMSSCLLFAGDLSGFEKAMHERKVSRLPDEKAKFFLKGRSGKAWGFAANGGQFALTWLDDGVCTFFVREADIELFIKKLNEKFIKMNNEQGVVFSPEGFPSGVSDLDAFGIKIQDAKASPLKTGTNIFLSTTSNKTKGLAIAISTKIGG